MNSNDNLRIQSLWNILYCLPESAQSLGSVVDLPSELEQCALADPGGASGNGGAGSSLGDADSSL